MVSPVSAEKPRQARHEAQRLEILEAAAVAIAEHGFHGMTMRGLARATGRGLATFYNYFSCKEEVLFSLQTEAFDTMATSVNSALEGVVEPSERLYVFVLNHLHFLAERRAVMRVLVHEASALPSGKRKTVRRLKEAYFNICRDIVTSMLTGSGEATDNETNVDSVEVERITYSVFGMLNWSYGWYEPRMHGTPQDVAKTIHALAVGGLVGRCQQAPILGGLDGQFVAAATPTPDGFPGGHATASNGRLQADNKGSKRAHVGKVFEQEAV